MRPKKTVEGFVAGTSLIRLIQTSTNVQVGDSSSYHKGTTMITTDIY